MESSRHQFHPLKRRATPIPVAPPRVPTPMPPNNNNGPRSNTKEDDSGKTPMPSGQDTQRLISKTPFRLLDNDVKTAWINPRLISKIDLDLIKKTDYVLPYERNMNGQHQQHNNPPPSHLKPSSCGRNHDREWENTTTAVNGRARHGALSVPTATSTGTPEQSGVVVRRKSKPGVVGLRAKNMPMDPVVAKTGATRGIKSRLPQGTSRTVRSSTPVAINKNSGNQLSAKTAGQAVAIAEQPSQTVLTSPGGHYGVNHGTGVSGIAYHQKNIMYAGVDQCDSAGVFGVYAETKYVYAVNGIGNNLAQASAAAAFFAR